MRRVRKKRFEEGKSTAVLIHFHKITICEVVAFECKQRNSYFLLIYWNSLYLSLGAGAIFAIMEDKYIRRFLKLSTSTHIKIFTQ